MTPFYKALSTPVGKLTLVANEQSLIRILWEDEAASYIQTSQAQRSKNNSILQETEKQLLEYLDLKRKTFKLPLAFIGTEFQKKVWLGLSQIPFGETRSYSDLALQVGFPRAFRAVGTANGKNPIPIIIPCHRVIGTNGTLRGFAGGMERKIFLLELENQKKTQRQKMRQASYSDFNLR